MFFTKLIDEILNLSLMLPKEILSVTEKYTERTEKLAQSYQTLYGVEEIDIATTPKDLVWKDGKISLYRYKRDKKATIKTPLLICYALVNTEDMMDLQADRSVIRKFLDLGLDVYIINWGYVSRADRYTTMDDYINGYLGACVDFIRKEHNIQKINLLGVCQGGTFSLIYSAIHPEKIKNLITMVTPVDFSNKEGLLFQWSEFLDVDAIIENNGGVMPGDLLNISFDMLKPMAKIRKYTNVVDIMDDEDKLMNFLRMEKWVANSPDQAGECFKQFIKDLYQGNKLIKGELSVGKYKVSLDKITMPVLNIYAEADHLVPPPCSIPLEKHIPSKDVQTYKFPGGHIGVFVGARSQNELSPTIVKWLSDRD
ncbi:MAG: class III poly(R)-hydroxyalkanoic acid synthase subunit PhaC [Thermonemataceae bacterium]|nr:class III poly(R)-hydroxyalkanoic acid synthase subunit PhaC [Thermonemataceae bacterium]